MNTPRPFSERTLFHARPAATVRRLSLRAKVFVLFAGAALLMLVPALLLIADAVEREVYARATGQLSDASRELRQDWTGRDENLAQSAATLTVDPRVADAWSTESPGTLQRRIQGNVQKLAVIAVDTAGRKLAAVNLDGHNLAEHTLDD